MPKLLELDITTQLAEFIAATIGGDVSAERVIEVVHRANSGGFIFHGVKREAYVPAVLEEGVAPLTPESHGSHWTTGWRLFLGNPDSLNTYDSTFFHYAPSRGASGTRMTIAVTSPESLGNGLAVRPNSELVIPTFVPRDRIHVLRVEGGDWGDPQAAYQQAGQQMFDLVEAVVSGYFTPGGLSTA